MFKNSDYLSAVCRIQVLFSLVTLLYFNLRWKLIFVLYLIFSSILLICFNVESTLQRCDTITYILFHGSIFLFSIQLFIFGLKGLVIFNHYFSRTSFLSIFYQKMIACNLVTSVYPIYYSMEAGRQTTKAPYYTMIKVDRTWWWITMWSTIVFNKQLSFHLHFLKP